MKNGGPPVEKSFLHVHVGGGKSTVQRVEGWTAPVKAKVPGLPWVPPPHTEPAGMGEKHPRQVLTPELLLGPPGSFPSTKHWRKCSCLVQETVQLSKSSLSLP